jgi:hypothetical protein
MSDFKKQIDSDWKSIKEKSRKLKHAYDAVIAIVDELAGDMQLNNKYVLKKLRLIPSNDPMTTNTLEENISNLLLAEEDDTKKELKKKYLLTDLIKRTGISKEDLYLISDLL